MISSTESGNVEISHDFRCVKHFADRRTAVRPCCIMRKTIAVQVRYITFCTFLFRPLRNNNVELPSSVPSTERGR